MKISPWWLLVALSIGLGFMYIYLKFWHIPDETFSLSERKNYDVITLTLPNTIDEAIFGPAYWKAYHSLTDRLPCSICRDKAVPFMRFFHDVVNRETKKPIVYPENFNKHIDMISKLQKA